MDLKNRLKELKRHDLNCSVFDVYNYNGLSMQELLCQFFNKINECVEMSNNTLDITDWLVNEGLKEEVVKKLLLWYSDGTFEELINNTLFENLNNKIDEFTENMTYINVDSFGAVGDGVTDDTEAIEKCINYVTNNLKNTKKIVFSPGKNYMVNEIYPKSGNTIDFTGATIKKIPTIEGSYGVLSIHKQNNVTIINPTIIGDRKLHLGSDGESGHGIRIGGCKNIYVHNANISDCWGDGIYLGLPADTVNDNINLMGEIKINNCRRQGVSVVYCTNSFIDTIIAENINGTDPQCVLDIEPNRDFESVNNLHIKNVIGRNCANGINIILNTPDMNITIDKISLENCNKTIEIGNNPEPNKTGESDTISSKEKSITIGEIYISKCEDMPLVRIFNHTINYPKITINKIVCDRYEIKYTGTSSTKKCLILMESTMYSPLKCYSYGNVTIDEIIVNNLKSENIKTLVVINRLTTTEQEYPITLENVYINKIRVDDINKLVRPLTQASHHKNFYVDYPNVCSVYGANSTALMNGFNVVLTEHQTSNTIDLRANVSQCILYTNKYNFTLSFMEGTDKCEVYLDGVLKDVSTGSLSFTATQDKLYQISKVGETIYITSMFNTPKNNKIVSTSSRPTGVPQGSQVFDGQINKPIWYKGGGEWVDATGTVV